MSLLAFDDFEWLSLLQPAVSAIRQPVDQIAVEAWRLMSHQDVSTTWDAYSHAKEAVRVIIAIAKKEDPKCGPDGCLAKGRVVTPATVKDMPNLWSRDYK